MRRSLHYGVALVLALGILTAPVPTMRAQEKEKQKAAPKPLVLPPGTESFKDLAYGPHSERNTLDLFTPKSSSTLPLVIYIHGGGWWNGSKNGNNPAIFLLEKGYAVAAINYRLVDQAIFPAQIEDCKAAVRFLRANAKKYNLNPDSFGVLGVSAGGHLVALLGTTGGMKDLEGDGLNKDVSSRVQAVVDFYGPADFLHFKLKEDPASTVTKLLGGVLTEKRELAAKASPVTHTTKDDAPFLIFHGDEDPKVPLEQSEFLLSALRKAGVESELVVVKGGSHGGMGFNTAEQRVKITDFFNKHLKK